ncbi:MAG: hypothetical protein ACRDRU_25315 [Pseudonocardiaceae bacterium]
MVRAPRVGDAGPGAKRLIAHGNVALRITAAGSMIAVSEESSASRMAIMEVRRRSETLHPISRLGLPRLWRPDRPEPGTVGWSWGWLP